MATTTTNTCNEACWSAREDDCSCSCGGANHGILRAGHANFQEGAQPVRNAKIKGHRYLLRAVGSVRDISAERYGLQRAWYYSFPGIYDRINDTKANGEAVIARRASKDQERWPEVSELAKTRRPMLLWLREDLKDMSPA